MPSDNVNFTDISTLYTDLQHHSVIRSPEKSLKKNNKGQPSPPPLPGRTHYAEDEDTRGKNPEAQGDFGQLGGPPAARKKSRTRKIDPGAPTRALQVAQARTRDHNYKPRGYEFGSSSAADSASATSKNGISGSPGSPSRWKRKKTA